MPEAALVGGIVFCTRQVHSELYRQATHSGRRRTPSRKWGQLLGPSPPSVGRRPTKPVGFLLSMDAFGAVLELRMFEKFPPPIRETIEMFFRNPLLGVSADDHVGDLATELELRHPDLSVADAERIAREAIAERSGSSSEAH
jgi:hypothetical protein